MTSIRKLSQEEVSRIGRRGVDPYSPLRLAMQPMQIGEGIALFYADKKAAQAVQENIHNVALVLKWGNGATKGLYNSRVVSVDAGWELRIVRRS